MRFRLVKTILLGGGVLLTAARLGAVPDDVTFPEPRRSGGHGLFQVLQGRVQTDSFEARLIHWEVIGNLLWAGCGVNRPDQGGRTVPDLATSLPVRVYVLAAEGIWFYDPFVHRLVGLESGDFRMLATAARAVRAGGLDGFTDVGADVSGDGAAPVVLILAAATPQKFGLFTRQGESDQARELVLAALEAGHIAQNIQLFGVSEGLGVRIHTGLVQAESLVRKLELNAPDQILMALSVGYPQPR